MNHRAAQGFIPIPIIAAVLIASLLGGTAVKKVVDEKHEAKQLASTPVAVGETAAVRQMLPQGSAQSQEIIVGFKSSVARAQRDQVHQRQQGNVKKHLGRLNADVVTLPPGQTASDVVARYSAMPEIAYAEPNYLASALMSVNDPYYGRQWNLEKVGATTAFDTSQGGGSVVAVVDTGVDNTHPDLSGFIVTGFNTITNSTNTLDDNGHGTHVAGITAAHTNNGAGIASIAYKATILPVKVLDKDGAGTYADVAEGITYAADQGARIINLSLGGSSDSTTLKQAVSYAQGKGSMLVAAAGNNGSSTPSYPAAYQGVLAISASDSNDALASFSNYGSNIFVAAPGVSILSSIPGSNYQQYSGTSMAAPHVAGLLALTLAYKPALTNTDLINNLKSFSEKVGSTSYDANGWNQYYGYGRISAANALSLLAASPTPSPTPSPSPTPTASATAKPKKSPPARSRGQRFETTGIVDSKNLTDNKLSLRVEQGSPHIFRLLVNNMVDVYVESQSKLLYQGQQSQLAAIPDGSRVSINGELVNNTLYATELVAITDSQQTTTSGQGQGQGNQQAQEQQGNSSNAQSENTGSSNQNSNAAQQNVPEQAQNNGNNGQGNGQGKNDKVKGTSTSTWWELLKQTLLFW